MARQLLSPVPTIPSAYWTEEREAIQATVRDFAMKEVLPAANELDTTRGEIPMELRAKMGQLGLFGVMIGEEYGGAGLGLFEYVLVTEELARAWMSVASIIARGNGGMGGFSEEMRRKLLPRMARGECLMAYALSEPDAGSDIASIRTRAVEDGDEYVINGQKMWCTFADGADFLIIITRTTPYDPDNRHGGIRQFYVEKERGTLPPGVTGTPIRKIGYNGWKTWELAFDDFRVPAENMLGRERAGVDDKVGFRQAASGLSVARLHTAARSIGLARGAVEDSIAYAQERVQFGQPISDFQAIRFKLATMIAEVETCRAMMYQVANEYDAGTRPDTQAAMIKYLASEMAERVTSEGIQVHGGAGYTTDFPLERYWRDARLTKIFEGTSEIQQRIISDSYLPRPAVR
ncbi:MAG: acyl-CoA dehydrogenase [Actinomycetia bacterium]|nr:acyl-CoA dehydrogenase [Actinomycetes bacterium]